MQRAPLNDTPLPEPHIPATIQRPLLSPGPSIKPTIGYSSGVYPTVPLHSLSRSRL